MMGVTLPFGTGMICNQTSVCHARWRHNELDSVSDHQPHDCLLNRLFGRRSKKASKLRVSGLCAGNTPGTGEFSAQMASNAENVSIWWRHHVTHEYPFPYKHRRRWNLPNENEVNRAWPRYVPWPICPKIPDHVRNVTIKLVPMVLDWLTHCSLVTRYNAIGLSQH